MQFQKIILATFLKKRTSDLIIDKYYYIKDMKSLKTKFGRAIKVTLEDDQDVFRSFLPKRLAESFTDEIMSNITTSEKRYTLTYKGHTH